MHDLSLPIAFFAGLVSFFSPCFFPVIPGFFALMATGERSEKSERSVYALRARLSNVYVSLAFVFGFAAVFFIVGVAFQTTLAYTGVTAFRKTIAVLGGFLIIFFGLVMMGVFPDRVAGVLRGSEKSGRAVGALSSYFGRRALKGLSAFFFGAGFAAAWSPCIGAVLGSVLSLALSQPDTGAALFFAYTVGFGLPLVILGMFAEELSHALARFESHTIHVQSIFGSLLVVAGIFMVLFPPEAVLKCF